MISSSYLRLLGYLCYSDREFSFRFKYPQTICNNNAGQPGGLSYLFFAAAALSLCLLFLNQFPTWVGVRPVAWASSRFLLGLGYGSEGREMLEAGQEERLPYPGGTILVEDFLFSLWSSEFSVRRPRLFWAEDTFSSLCTYLQDPVVSLVASLPPAMTSVNRAGLWAGRVCLITMKWGVNYAMIFFSVERNTMAQSVWAG